MLGFKTATKTYYIDGNKKELTGDGISSPIKFTDILTVIGCPGVALQTDGKPFITEKITTII